MYAEITVGIIRMIDFVKSINMLGKYAQVAAQSNAIKGRYIVSSWAWLIGNNQARQRRLHFPEGEQILCRFKVDDGVVVLGTLHHGAAGRICALEPAIGLAASGNRFFLGVEKLAVIHQRFCVMFLRSHNGFAIGEIDIASIAPQICSLIFVETRRFDKRLSTKTSGRQKIPEGSQISCARLYHERQAVSLHR